MKLSHLTRLAELAAARVPAALVTDLQSGVQDIFTAEHRAPQLNLSSGALTTLAVALAGDKSGETELDGRRCFALVRNPPARLVIVGAVHITQALAPMATLAGYEIFVIDPRRAFATAERFPGLTLSNAWPDEALGALKLDSRSALVTLTHDPKLDDPALIAGLRSPAFYIGALGSKKTHAARLQRLSAEGFSTDDLARIHGPAGLDIGAKSPAEIAVSVLAQLTAARHGRPANRPSDRATP